MSPNGSSAVHPSAGPVAPAPALRWRRHDEPPSRGCVDPRGAPPEPPAAYAPAHYELRIEGHLGERWSAWFGGLSLIHEDDGTTSLRGAVTDQAELHGLLAKVRDLGTTLISVKTVDAPDRHIARS